MNMCMSTYASHLGSSWVAWASMASQLSFILGFCCHFWFFSTSGVLSNRAHHNPKHSHSARAQTTWPIPNSKYMQTDDMNPTWNPINNTTPIWLQCTQDFFNGIQWGLTQWSGVCKFECNENTVLVPSLCVIGLVLLNCGHVWTGLRSGWQCQI